MADGHRQGKILPSHLHNRFMAKPTVRVFLGVSLDGCIAGNDHDLSWLECVTTDPPEDTGYADLMSNTDTMVIGRTTYDVIAKFDPWPFDGRRVVVVTSRPLEDARVESMSGTIVEVIDELGRQGAQGIYLDGGSLVRQALVERRVDELTLSWLPYLLGEGVKLFDGLPELRQQWRLVQSRTFPSGLVQATYQPLAEG